MALPGERVSYREAAPVALVIGCGNMGTGIARSLGRSHPLLVVDNNAETLEQTVETLRYEGFHAEGQACDITDRAQVGALAATIAKGPGVKVLAHVAALGNSPLGWRAVVDVDLVGVHLVARAVEPYFVRGGVGIFISSKGAYLSRKSAEIDALLDDPFQENFYERLAEAYGEEPHPIEAYFMAKRGMNRFAEVLAVEWADKEVRALSLSPGYINTTMGRTSGAVIPVPGDNNMKRAEPRGERLLRDVPLKRHATVQEVNEVVAFLASDAASYINGVDIIVDGGQSAMARYRERNPGKA